MFTSLRETFELVKFKIFDVLGISGKAIGRFDVPKHVGGRLMRMYSCVFSCRRSSIYFVNSFVLLTVVKHEYPVSL